MTAVIITGLYVWITLMDTPVLVDLDFIGIPRSVWVSTSANETINAT